MFWFTAHASTWMDSLFCVQRELASCHVSCRLHTLLRACTRACMSSMAIFIIWVLVLFFCSWLSSCEHFSSLSFWHKRNLVWCPAHLVRGTFILQSNWLCWCFEFSQQRGGGFSSQLILVGCWSAVFHIHPSSGVYIKRKASLDSNA